MLEVREHIEKVVETLVGDDLDETSVIRLVNHPSCKYFSSMYSYFLIIKFVLFNYLLYEQSTCFKTLHMRTIVHAILHYYSR